MLDLVIVIVSLLLSNWLSRHSLSVQQMLIAIVVVPLGFQMACHSWQAYRRIPYMEWADWCWRALAAWVSVIAVLCALLYAFKIGDQFPRSIIGSWALSVALSMTLVRLLLFRLSLSAYVKGKGLRPVICVGPYAYTRRVARQFYEDPRQGLKVVGVVCDDPPLQPSDHFPILGRIQEIDQVVEKSAVEQVLITAPLRRQDVVYEVMAKLATRPIQITLVPDVKRFSLIGFNVHDLAGQPAFALSAARYDADGAVIKWLEDKILSFLILLLISPIMVAIAIAIKITMPGPVFFVQERHGLHGKAIRVYKFRSMRVPKDADEAARASKGVECGKDGRFQQASGSDNRITWLGNILRKSSLDELPQFLNVLKGDMSIVGPRPHPIGLNLQYSDVVDQLMQRHLMKPGITGLAQISGARGETRSSDDMSKRIRYDLEYIRNWSLWLDLKIIVQTIWRGFVNFQP